MVDDQNRTDDLPVMNPSVRNLQANEQTQVMVIPPYLIGALYSKELVSRRRFVYSEPYPSKDFLHVISI